VRNRQIAGHFALNSLYFERARTRFLRSRRSQVPNQTYKGRRQGLIIGAPDTYLTSYILKSRNQGGGGAFLSV